jgi:hypothetical protein
MSSHATSTTVLIRYEQHNNSTADLIATRERISGVILHWMEVDNVFSPPQSQNKNFSSGKRQGGGSMDERERRSTLVVRVGLKICTTCSVNTKLHNVAFGG